MGQAGKRKRAQEQQQQTSAPKEKLSPRDKAVQLLRGMTARLVRLAAKVGKLPPELVLSIGTSEVQAYTMPVREGIAAVAQAFDALSEQVEALPPDWKPASGKRGRRSLVVAVGDHVQIREKSAKLYVDMFPADADLTVTDVRAALIGVQHDAAGATVYVPRGHLKTAGAPAEG